MARQSGKTTGFMSSNKETRWQTPAYASVRLLFSAAFAFMSHVFSTRCIWNPNFNRIYFPPKCSRRRSIGSSEGSHSLRASTVKVTASLEGDKGRRMGAPEHTNPRSQSSVALKPPESTGVTSWWQLSVCFLCETKWQLSTSSLIRVIRKEPYAARVSLFAAVSPQKEKLFFCRGFPKNARQPTQFLIRLLKAKCSDPLRVRQKSLFFPRLSCVGLDVSLHQRWGQITFKCAFEILIFAVFGNIHKIERTHLIQHVIWLKHAHNKFKYLLFDHCISYCALSIKCIKPFFFKIERQHLYANKHKNLTYYYYWPFHVQLHTLPSRNIWKDVLNCVSWSSLLPFLFHRRRKRSRQPVLPIQLTAMASRQRDLRGSLHASVTICQSVSFFLPQKHLDQQAWWIFNQKVAKLSAMRHHLPRPSWPRFLFSLAKPDKPLEGLSACSDGWARLQRTRGRR